MLDGKDKFALRDEEDVLGNVYPKYCCVEGRVRDKEVCFYFIFIVTSR